MRYTLLLLPFLFTGCTYSYFEAYNGPQDQWPRSAGDFSKKVKGIPVYDSWPARQYEVLGRVQTDNFNNARMARTARTYKADAIVIVSAETINLGTKTEHGMLFFGSGWAVSTPDKTTPITTSLIRVLFIRWTDQK
jgi:hypothetical protein